MVSGDSNSTPLSVLERAEAHFPGQAQLVQRLFYGSDAFHSMCEDLAIAVETLRISSAFPKACAKRGGKNMPHWLKPF